MRIQIRNPAGYYDGTDFPRPSLQVGHTWGNITFGFLPRLICNDLFHILILATSQRAFWECREYANSSVEKYSGLKLKTHQPEVFNEPNSQAR
jgi:hypothetical protein